MDGPSLPRRDLVFPGCRRRPIVGAIVGSGLAAASAAVAGADFLMALSAGVYRNLGASTLGPFLPFANANDLTETLLRRHVLSRARGAPVFAGLLANDPTLPLDERLDTLARLGVRGVVNYPSVGFLDGVMRHVFETEGCTTESELAMLARARARGFATLAFVGLDEDAARTFASAELDGFIVTAGLTRDLQDIREKRDRLQHAISRVHRMLDALAEAPTRVWRLAFGGPFTQLDDIERLLEQSDFDGFVGGSTFERIPVQSGIAAMVSGVKSFTQHRRDLPTTGRGQLIGASAPMRAFFRLVERAAAYDLNVCIEGESGTGKELVATEVHRSSARAHGPFVTLNCGAIPESLLESELFGHERGAFTGADRQRPGKFELASGGTLFLDEVADLSPRGQVSLLRVIQQSEVTRVGADEPIPIDVRIICASNRPLADLVEHGAFRADLFYRLNNLTLRVPPLRERRDDLPLLVDAILQSLGTRMGRRLRGLSTAFHEKLAAHAWPGNVRELQHVLGQAALHEDGSVLEGRAFIPHASGATRRLDESQLFASQPREATRHELAQRAVAEAAGNKSAAARALGVSRKTIYAWLRERPPAT